VNIPNILTLLRIFFVPVIVASLLTVQTEFVWSGIHLHVKSLALFVFILASATDLLDGYLARRWQQETTVGTLLDPIADKLLISAALVAMVELRLLPAWVVIVQIGREFAVTGFRSIALSAGYTISPSNWGKWKMAGQVLMVGLLIASLIDQRFYQPGLILTYVITAVSIYGALDYFFVFWRGIDEAVKRRSRAQLLLQERRRLREERKRRRVTAAGD
jgi:CDP-diacylglycerol---glycerol-3-phosphate 3-phosphatidyltransferase